MSRMAFLTRVFVFSHVPLPRRSTAGRAPSALAYFWMRSNASTGTVTTECAYFGVPTVALYRTSWTNYQIARRIVKVKYLAMPNLLAKEEVFPEFIQAAAKPDDLARAALDLLRDAPRRARIKTRLAEITASLGAPGASRRAAKFIVGTLGRAKLGSQATIEKQ